MSVFFYIAQSLVKKVEFSIFIFVYLSEEDTHCRGSTAREDTKTRLFI